MTGTIPADTEFVDASHVRNHLIDLIREHLPGGIYVDVGDATDELVLISRGVNSAGIWLLKVHRAQLAVCGDED